MVITAVTLQDGSLTKGNTITHLAGIRDYQVITAENTFIMELGTQRIVTQIMAVLMDFHQDGSLIKASIITALAGTVDFQVIIMGAIFIMDHGIQLIIIRLLEVKAITPGKRRKIKCSDSLLMPFELTINGCVFLRYRRIMAVLLDY
jgi:hypothetical protein